MVEAVCICTEVMILKKHEMNESIHYHFEKAVLPYKKRYTAKLLFYQSPTRHSDYYCDNVVTVL